MASLNKVIIMGNLGKDVELRLTQGGTPVANFSVATTSTYKDQNGEKKQKTEWHRVIVWGRQAENCNAYLSKGSTVLVEGELNTRTYDDQATGVKRYVTEIKAHSVTFVSTKKSGEDSSEGDSGPMTEEDLSHIPF